MPPISERYTSQVRLLLAVLPHVSACEDFALKGGTAINFYYRNGPRLSVDIDLHYLPNNDRDAALVGIRENVEKLASAVTAALPSSTCAINPKTFNSLVTYQGTTIKIEPNHVIRGTLLPPVNRPLCQKFAAQFETAPRMQCLDHAEVYAGKLCAALDRQHPRDLFDMHGLLQEDGLTRELIDVFLVYLISQGRPIAEILSPNVQPIDDLYQKQFTGMADAAVNLDQLKEIQQQLPALVRAQFTDTDKDFLCGFKLGQPDWSLLRHSHARHLPAVRWKQFNLTRMVGTKRKQAVNRLAQVLGTR